MAQVVDGSCLEVELSREILPLKNFNYFLKLDCTFGFLTSRRQNKVFTTKRPPGSNFNC